MIRGLYTAVSGLITQEAKEDVITNNIANANTTGFKNDQISVKSFNDMLIQNYDKMIGDKNVRNIIGSLSMGSAIDGTTTSFTPGDIENTGNATDFAIDGNGFFTVLRNDGVNSKEYYTRDGEFHVNSAGILVDSSGDEVLGKNVRTGNIEPIQVGDGTIDCDSNGNISINNKSAYKFATADFNNYASLSKVGDNLYDGSNPNFNAAVHVKQKALEKSNVNIINEMVNMMSVMRTFETNQKVVQSIDETLNKTVNDVGSVK